MSSIIGQIGPEQLKLFALELGKIAALDFVYSLASTVTSQAYLESRSQQQTITINIIY